MRSKTFYWQVALICAVVAALTFPLNSWFRQGYQPEILWREAIFGGLFTLSAWWYNLVGFPFLARHFFGEYPHRYVVPVRIVSTLLFSYMLIWMDERLGGLHIDDDLQGYVLPEYANEFRAAITAACMLLVIFFLDTSAQINHVRMENERLKLENSVAQFEALKQQINPHFLFNSLNILKTMVKNQDPHGEEYIVRMSELYRSLLLSNQREKIPLSEELAVLDNYVYMLKARFENKLQVNQTLQPEAINGFVPPLSLQMLVENCIKHNVVSQDKPLQVDIYSENGYLVVRNNLQRKRSVEGSTQIGLENINERYKMLAGKDIVIESDDRYFTVKLPLINN